MWEERVVEGLDCAIRRVLITQIGLVQIVEEAPAVIAERICVTQVFPISAVVWIVVS